MFKALIGSAGALGFLLVAVVMLALGSAAQADQHGRWEQVENKANCAVWNGSPVKNEKVTWTGACVNGKAEGQGRLMWRLRTDIYTGTMRNGKKHGRGVWVNSMGEEYEGDFVDDKKMP